eukprot:Gb_19929 [translate_table: standard]
MKKGRNFCCGFSPGNDVLEDIIVPVSNEKGVRIFEILKNVDDDDNSNSTKHSKKIEKNKSGVKKGVSCSPVPISPLSRCFPLFRLIPEDFSRSSSSNNSSPKAKGKEELGSNGEEIGVLNRPVEKVVCRKLDFSCNKVTAPKLVSNKENSQNSNQLNAEDKDPNNSTVGSDQKINNNQEAENLGIVDESLCDQHKLKISSKMFKSSSRKGDNLICPARIPPELQSDLDLPGTKRSRGRSPKYLKPQQTKSSKRQGTMVSRSLFSCVGSALNGGASPRESKMAENAIGIPHVEQSCKQGSSTKNMAFGHDWILSESNNKQEKCWQDQRELRSVSKKRKAAYGLPILPARDALKWDTFRFPGAAKAREEFFFNFGLGFGVMFMVTSSKNEIEKLRELLKETESLVKNLQQEINRRDLCASSQIVHTANNSISGCHQDTNEETKKRKDEVGFGSQSSSASLAAEISTEEYDGSAHSIITTETMSRHSGMAQLEAELEAELERMQLDLTDGRSEQGSFAGIEMMDTIVDNVDSSTSEIPGKKSNHERENVCGGNYSVSPIELEKRLHQLLQKRQEEHIAELEADLKSTENKLLDKEKELSWWKECVWQLSVKPSRATTTPGEESIASMSTESSGSLFLPYSYQQDDPIQENCNLKDSEAFNCCSNNTNCPMGIENGSREHFDMRAESAKDMAKPENKREKTILAGHSETHQILTVACNAHEKGEGTERKDSSLLCLRRKGASVDNLQNYSMAIEDESCDAESNAFQRRKVFSSHSGSNTPVGSFHGNMNSQITHNRILENALQNETHYEGYGQSRSPVLSKIKYWETLSRVGSSSRQSCDLDYQVISPKCDHSLASVSVKGDANYSVDHQLETINSFCETSATHIIMKRNPFGSAEHDAVLEAFAYSKSSNSDCGDVV